jgi:hypothetical protein
MSQLPTTIDSATKGNKETEGTRRDVLFDKEPMRASYLLVLPEESESMRIHREILSNGVAFCLPVEKLGSTKSGAPLSNQND